MADNYYRADINADGHRVPEADKLKKQAVDFVKELRARGVLENEALVQIERNFPTFESRSKTGSVSVNTRDVKNQFLRDVAHAANQAIDADGNFKTGSSGRFVDNLDRVAKGVASTTHGLPMWARMLHAVEQGAGKFGTAGKVVAAGVAGTLAVAGGANAAEVGVAALDAAAPGLGTLALGEGPKKGKLCGAFGQAGGALAGVGAGLVGTGMAGPVVGVGAGMLVEAGATPALTAGCERVADGPLANVPVASYSSTNGATIGGHRPPPPPSRALGAG